MGFSRNTETIHEQESFHEMSRRQLSKLKSMEPGISGSLVGQSNSFFESGSGARVARLRREKREKNKEKGGGVGGLDGEKRDRFSRKSPVLSYARIKLSSRGVSHGINVNRAAANWRD
ncbi:hypothetical protein KM043_007924 [Ampulex compressa]|nr:hypothetical protein KM043_007924 [Ampulex compressa]